MVPEQLEPSLELLREEYVLVQAWKKTASYIRYHNWFSDTLALDRAAVNLPTFIGELRERLQILDLHSSRYGIIPIFIVSFRCGSRYWTRSNERCYHPGPIRADRPFDIDAPQVDQSACSYIS